MGKTILAHIAFHTRCPLFIGLFRKKRQKPRPPRRKNAATELCINIWTIDNPVIFWLRRVLNPEELENRRVRHDCALDRNLRNYLITNRLQQTQMLLMFVKY